MRKTEKYNKHMTLAGRIEIQVCLNRGMTFKAIGNRIGKGQTIERIISNAVGPKCISCYPSKHSACFYSDSLQA